MAMLRENPALLTSATEEILRWGTVTMHFRRTALADTELAGSRIHRGDKVVLWFMSGDYDERQFLEAISSESDRLAQLVSNLLDLSRIEAGLLSLRRMPCDLEELVDRARRRLPPTVATIAVDIPKDLPFLDVDAARLEVVLHNLLSNAQAYGSGHIRVSAENQDGTVTVQVVDDGPGIEADELPHIFERFYRAERGSQLRAGGTGLGLAICKALVEAHGGSIWAESSEGRTIIAFTIATTQLARGAAAEDHGSVPNTARAS